MNKQDMMNLLHHIITVSRHWHLEYGRLFISGNAYDQLVKNRNEFDKDLLQKGQDIINGIERESDIKKIVVLLEGYKIELTTDDYSSNQLRQIADDLLAESDIDTQNATKKLCIDKNAVIGFELTYVSDYSKQFRK